MYIYIYIYICVWEGCYAVFDIPVMLVGVIVKQNTIPNPWATLVNT